VEKLVEDSGVASNICRDAFIRFLTRVSSPETERGGNGAGAFLAFKLHRFISGAGEIFTTLTHRPRRVLFEGQLEDPEAPGNRLYPTRFCRSCGQEVHVVTKSDDAGEMLFLPRSIDDTPQDNPEGDVAGYLVPVSQVDQEFDGSIESFPEDWKEESKGVERLRSNRKERVPQRMTIGPDGRLYLLSDQGGAIARLPDSLDPGGGSVHADALWRIAGSPQSAEGLVILNDGTPLVGVDTKSPGRNLLRLKQLPMQ
jgi:hypothetical protein